MDGFQRRASAPHRPPASHGVITHRSSSGSNAFDVYDTYGDDIPALSPAYEAAKRGERSDGCGRVTAASSAGRVHSPAVWLFQEDLPPDSASSGSTAAHAEIGEEARMLESLTSANRGRVAQPRHAPWVVDSLELSGVNNAPAPSPRVLDNRVHIFPSTNDVMRPSLEHPVAWNTNGSRAPHGATAPSEEVSLSRSQSTEEGPRRTSSAISHGPSWADTRTKSWNSRVTPVHRQARRRVGPRASPSSTSPPPPLPIARMHGRAASSPVHSPSSSKGSRSASPSSASSSPAPEVLTSPASAAASPYPAVEMFNRDIGAASPSLAGLGPLMVVHLDVLPARHAAIAERSAPIRGTEEPRHEMRDADTHQHAGGTYTDRYTHRDPWAAQLEMEEQETAAREMAALYAKLEVAEQRVRMAEQQVVATAEVRAAELVQAYKAEERKRRAHFQASLDALREENRELTAKLEAAARAPAMGWRAAPATGSGKERSTEDLPSASPTQQRFPVSQQLVLAPSLPPPAALGEAEVTRQVQAVEAYWRDRLRTAERHWEDEMARQSRQRREALDQVEELVRTVEQSQEELRYTRRQAARLKEENTRLATTAVAAGGSTGTSAAFRRGSLSSAESDEETARLRRQLKEHEHREAALLAQVESYGEEATQVRLRYEAALERAQQDLEAERRRSTEMVKLYGSQLEALHRQLREAKVRSASR